MKNRIYIYIVISAVLSFLPLFSGEDIKIDNKYIEINITKFDELHTYNLSIDSMGFYLKYNFAAISGNKFAVSSKVGKFTETAKDNPQNKCIKFQAKNANNNYTLEHLGTYKGIDLYQIRIYPAFILNKKYCNIATQKILINFEDSIQLNYNYSDADIQNYFDDVINPQHLAALANSNYQKADYINLAKKLPKSNTDYNPNRNYIEINTTDDGIGYIPIRDLLTVDGNLFVNKYTYKYLHLVRNNTEQRYYIKSENNLLNANDTIFFIASRNMGDTTFYDHYNATAKYYVYYDTSYAGEHLAENKFTQYSNILDKIETKFHYETDDFYVEGQWGNEDANFLDPYTVSGEGWYESAFRPKLTTEDYVGGDTLKEFNKMIFPAKNSSVTFNFSFASTKVNKAIEYNHRVKAQFNNFIDYTQDYKYIRGSYTKYNINSVHSDSLFYGVNNAKYYALPLRTQYSGKDSLDGEMAFDYIEISGNFKPVVIGDKIAFNTEKISENTQLSLYPFSSDKVIALDTVNNLIFDYKSEKGFALSINTSNILKTTTFYVNNELVYSTDKIGFHILYFDNTGKPFYESIEEDKILEFISRVNNLKTNLYLAVAINKLNLSTNELNLLKSINLNTQDYSQNDCLAYLIERDKKTLEGEDKGIIAKHSAFVPNEAGTKYSIAISLEAGKSYNITVSGDNKLQKPVIAPTFYSNIKDTANECNYLVISSHNFSDCVEKYLEYRKIENKNITTKAVYVEDIFKELNGGRKNPQALKDYITYAYKNWKIHKLNTILLLGDASTDPRRLHPAHKMIDYVPSFGYPTTDIWYVLMDGDGDFIPDMNISRIPIQTKQDFENYFEKLKTFEKSPNAPWKNSNLFMVGGANTAEINHFSGSYIDPLIATFSYSKVCFEYEKIQKSTDNAVSESDASKIIKAIDKGKLFTFFYGHGSPDVFDMDGWMPNTLSNYGKYGFFTTASCNTGFFGLPTGYTRFEQLLFAENKGFIYCMGNSTADDVGTSFYVTRYIMDSILNGQIRNYSQAVINGKVRAIKNYPSTDWISPLKRYLLTGVTLGDPMINIPIDTLAELYLLPEEYKIVGSSGSSIITENDENIMVDFIVRNAGIRNFDSVSVIITDKFGDKIDTFKIVLRDICPFRKVESFKIPIKNKIGLHLLTISVDPDSTLVESRRNNNILARQFEVVKNSMLAVEPMNYWNVNYKSPRFRFINPVINADSVKYTLSIRNENDDLDIATADNSNLKIKNNVIDWAPNINLKNNSNYIIEGSFSDPATGNSLPIYVPFHTTDESIGEITEHKLSNTQMKELITNNLSFNQNTQTLGLSGDSIKVDFMSMCGNFTKYDHTVFRGVYLKIDNIYYISNYSQIGFHILKFNKDFSKIDSKYYETWGNNNSDDNAGDNHTTIEMIKYLRDSVKAGDYIFIGTLGSAFRLLSLHNKLHTAGSWDTLKTVLDKMGAKHTYEIDTLYKVNNAWPVSYVFAAHIGEDYTIAYDKADIQGDTARIICSLPKKYDEAGFSFSINNIDYLKNIKIDASDILANNTLAHKLYGLNKQTGQYEYINEYAGALSNDYNIYDKYNSYKFDYNIKIKDNKDNNIDIRGIRLYYVPSAEADINYLSPLSNNILKADRNTLNISLRNLSIRRSIDTLSMNIAVNDKSNIIYRTDTAFYKVQPNSEINYSYDLQTDNYSDTINVISSIKNISKNDIYQFNNIKTQSQYFAADLELPTVELEVDGHIVQNHEYVPKYPTFKIIIRDNSKKAITDKNISLRLNSRNVYADKVPLYEFKSFGKDTNVRGYILFKPDSLDYDENIFRITVEDANQNKDTVLYRLMVSRKGVIKHISIYPNPVRENSTIFFNYAAPALDGYAQIDIFDPLGRVIKTQKTPLNIGNNYIPIVLRGENNEKLATGVYYYRISILNSQIEVEQMVDKFVIIE